MNQLAVLAIGRRHVMKLLYPGFCRTVEPHAYGLDKNGNALLLCYQTAGGTGKDDSAGWKTLDPSEATRVIETGECFAAPRAGYASENCIFRAIFARI